MIFETILPTSGKWWILAQEQNYFDDNGYPYGIVWQLEV
jgi:hypothetical protein